MFNPALMAASSARLSGFLLTALAAVLAAQLTWQMLAPGDHVSLSPVSRAPIEHGPEMRADETQSILLELARRPLFGTPQAATPIAPIAAPDTQLNLRLLGILAGTPEQRGSGFAVIAEGNRPERLFGIGDPIGNAGATVQAIYPDRVILNRNGRLETLRFPRTDSRRAPAQARASDSAAPIPAAPETIEGETAGVAPEPILRRSQWLDNPESLMRAVQVRPVLRDGQLHGLMVRPNQSGREFQQAGLEPGDILTSVNGVPVSAIQAPEMLFAELGTATQIQLTVERSGQTRALTVRLLD